MEELYISIVLIANWNKKPPECLEYVGHEMAHLLEPSHNSRFIDLMDQFMPSWRNNRDELNRSPLGHEEWGM